MKVGDLVRALETIAPLAYAEDWDNVGLLAGDAEAPLTRALLCIDCTREVVAEAENTKCEAIVAYHPPIFRPVSRVTSGGIVYELVKRGLSLYAPHTALDAAAGGTNDVLADAVGLTNRVPIRASVAKDSEHKLVTFVPADALAKVSDALFAAGAGRIGNYRSCSFRAPGTGDVLRRGGGTKPVVGSAEKLGDGRRSAARSRRPYLTGSRRGPRPPRLAPLRGARLRPRAVGSPPPRQPRNGAHRGRSRAEDRGSLLVRIKEARSVSHTHSSRGRAAGR